MTEKTKLREGYHLIDAPITFSNSGSARYEGVPNGWNADNRFMSLSDFADKDRFIRIRDDSEDTFYALNRDFHWQIAKAAHNQYYERFLGEVYNKVEVYMLFYDKSIDNSTSYRNHADMLSALRDRDKERAKAAVIRDNEKALGDIRYSFSSV